ncbi:hypothetical protein PFICI_09740 [Pestalotiopsis fici W106-1]|uniref:Mitochondrial fission process protein 1 n=1 Tax=Pestalotiopsis fici (strain W106-1 / CGMCC3.15140) TaxID=1229662 RepID=W3WUY2_PESFW|nr:uncharacterized protein PFICI_09740 [Pestalotiopsis fici W106-1]ETS77678.1 hypothetical protein PFICI_09740 [Pestalotiopsis fici W106-1]
MAQESKIPTFQSPSSSNLQWCFLADAVAAVTAAASITPIITATDRSVVESVSQGRPLLRTLGKHLLCPLREPRRFFSTRAVFVVWTLYAVTYFTANTSETLVERFLDKDKAPTGTIVSAAVFSVNTPLSVWKDVRFAQFFGRPSGGSIASKAVPSGTTASACSSTLPNMAAAAATACTKPVPPRGTPVSVSAAFLVRDIITVFGSIGLAPHISAAIPDSVAEGAHAKASVAQLIVPAMTQAVATPAHLLGLDLYNRQGKTGVVDRLDHARKKLFSTTIMRAFRLIPAFGIGIVLNKDLRSTLRNHKGVKMPIKQ